jgi:hypothetical protein
MDAVVSWSLLAGLGWVSSHVCGGHLCMAAGACLACHA